MHTLRCFRALRKIANGLALPKVAYDDWLGNHQRQVMAENARRVAAPVDREAEEREYRAKQAAERRRRQSPKYKARQDARLKEEMAAIDEKYGGKGSHSTKPLPKYDPFQYRPNPGSGEYQQWWGTLSPDQQNTELKRLQKEDPTEYEVMKMAQNDQQAADAAWDQNKRYYYSADGKGVMEALPEDARAMGYTEELTPGDLKIYKQYQADRNAWEAGEWGDVAEPTLDFTGYQGTSAVSMHRAAIEQQRKRRDEARKAADAAHTNRMKEIGQLKPYPGETPVQFQMRRRLLIQQATDARNKARSEAGDNFAMENDDLHKQLNAARRNPTDTGVAYNLRAGAAGQNRTGRTKYRIFKQSPEIFDPKTVADDKPLLIAHSGLENTPDSPGSTGSFYPKNMEAAGIELPGGLKTTPGASGNFYPKNMKAAQYRQGIRDIVGTVGQDVENYWAKRLNTTQQQQQQSKVPTPRR